MEYRGGTLGVNCTGQSGSIYSSLRPLLVSRRYHMLLFTVVTVLVVHTIKRSSGDPMTSLPCMASKMCSRGQSQTFHGDIRNSSRLNEMLKKVSFRGEMMFAAAGFPPRVVENYGRVGQLDAVGQLYDEIYSMGYAHFALVSTSSLICELIRPHRPRLSCVWDSVDFSRAGLGLLHHKIMFMARAVRAGFNVMALDSDVLFFQDPYVSLRQNTPLLKDANFLCIPEGGNAYNCNAGFMYVQNANPSGPVAWVFYDIIDHILRRVDDGLDFPGCTTYDQLLIMDSLTTSAAGLPLYPETLRSCHAARSDLRFNASNGQSLILFEVLRNVETLRVDRGFRTTISPTETWMQEKNVINLKPHEKEFFYGNLTLPNRRFQLPELGGRQYAQAPLGSLASIWHQTLTEDNPSAPWFDDDRPLSLEDERKLSLLFPDPDHSRINWNLPPDLFYHKAPGANRSTTEIFAHCPPWLAASLQASPKGLQLGRANTHDGLKRGPYLSIGHIHGLAKGSDKLIYRKILAAYNWTLGAEISSHRLPFVFSGPVDKIIILHPDIDLSRTQDFSEFSLIIWGLAQAARLSRRVLVLPTLPCETEWLDKGGSKKCEAPIPFGWQPDTPLFFPVNKEGFIIGGWARRRGRRSILEDSGDDSTKVNDPWWSRQRYRAIPGGFGRACAYDMHSIIAPEYQWWLKHTAVGRNASRINKKADNSNTAFLASPDFAVKGLGLSPLKNLSHSDHGWSLADSQASIPVTDAIKALSRLNSQPIVFISHPIMIRLASDITEDMIKANATSPAISPNAVLSHLNHKYTTSRCQWLKKRINEVEAGIKCKIDPDSGMIVKDTVDLRKK